MQKYPRFPCAFFALLVLITQSVQCMDKDWQGKARDSAINIGLFVVLSSVAGLGTTIAYNEYSTRRNKEERDRLYVLQRDQQDLELKRLILWDRQIPIDFEKTIQLRLTGKLELYKQLKSDHQRFCKSDDPMSRILCEQTTPYLLHAYRQLVPGYENVYTDGSNETDDNEFDNGNN